VVDHALEEVLPTVDVAVERHRLDPELLAELAHRQRGEPVRVDERDRGGDDPIPRQRLALRVVDAPVTG
jgi:hypothetical protein